MATNYNNKKVNITASDGGVKFNIKVIPGSSKSEMTDIIDGVVKIKLNSQPTEGQANKECIKLLSKTLKIPKSSIKIISGEKSKNKTIFINLNIDLVINKLTNLQIM